MKHLLFLIVFLSVFKIEAINADESCKNLKVCSDWATNKTGAKYELGNLDKRSLKLDKDFSFTEGDPDFVFNYILQLNDFVRIKRESGFQVVAMRDIKNFQFPSANPLEIPNSLDFFAVEFPMSNKNKVKNALSIVKKFISKNGRLLEVGDSPKILVIDSGIHLNTIKLIINELNK